MSVRTTICGTKDENLRDEYISRIASDIAGDKEGIEYRIEFFAGVGNFSKEMLDWMHTDAPVDKDVLLASFYAAEIWPFVPNSSTYLDLQSTGNIRLLDDIDLRALLVSYHIQADASRPGWSLSDEYRKVIRGIIPTEVQDQIRKNCPTTDHLDQRSSGFPPCELPGVDYDELAELYEPLRHNEAIRQTLTYRYSQLTVMLRLLGQQKGIAAEILAIIE